MIDADNDGSGGGRRRRLDRRLPSFPLSRSRSPPLTQLIHPLYQSLSLRSISGAVSVVAGEILSSGDGGTPPPHCTMASTMYKLVQTINSTKFRTEPFEDFYEVYEEIGR